MRWCRDQLESAELTMLANERIAVVLTEMDDASTALQYHQRALESAHALGDVVGQQRS